MADCKYDCNCTKTWKIRKAPNFTQVQTAPDNGTQGEDIMAEDTKMSKKEVNTRKKAVLSDRLVGSDDHEFTNHP